MESETTRSRALQDALSEFDDIGSDVLRDAGDLMSADQSASLDPDLAWDEDAVTRDSLVMTALDFGVTAKELQKYVLRAQSARLVKSAASDLTRLSEQFTKWLTGVYTTLEDATQAYVQTVSTPAGDVVFKTEKWRQNLYIAAEWEKKEQLFTIHARKKDSFFERLSAWWRRLLGRPVPEVELNVTVIGPRGATLTVQQFHEQYRRSADDDAAPRDRAFHAAREELYAAVDHDVTRGLVATSNLKR